MSSRALRRIQEGSVAQGLPVGPCGGEVSPSSSDPESGSENVKKSPKRAAKAKGNLFDLLQDDQSDKSDQASPSESESPEEVERAVRAKKQNRKGKKTKTKTTAAASTPPDPSDDDLDFLSRQLETLDASSLSEEASTNRSQSGSDTVVNRLFSIKAKNLNPDNELRRVLGLEVGQASKRKPGRDHRVHLRTQYILIQPKPQFAPAKDTGLSLKLKNSDAGVQYFVFSHSGKYAEAQRQFYMVAKSTEPEGFYYILNKCQHHVDTFLQLSELMRHGGHAQEASDLLERAIYILESSFHPNFNLCNGKVRLEYKHQVNRAFFIALFRYIATIAGRACHGTALEFCKLMYNIDPADPLAILLFVDFYAVRSQQYDWLISLYEEWNKTRNLNLLPNFAFSVALAYFKKGNIAQADNLLQHGLTLFPIVLLPLLNKCSIDADMGVVSHEFFLDAERKSNSNVKLLSSLYVERSHMLWKDASLLPWLERNANMVLASVDSKEQRVADILEKRAKCFVGTPLNIYRHAILSDLPETLKHLPHEVSSKGWVSFDPLPPADSIDSYHGDEYSGFLSDLENFQREIRNHFEREMQDPLEVD